jgi:cytochrome c nitrite reductase small subunit
MKTGDGRNNRPGHGMRRAVLIALAIGGVAAVWIGVFGAVRAYRFMEDDPSFCRTCHTMQQAWDRWETGEHRDVTCHSCHEGDPVNSMRQVYEYVTRQPDEVHSRPRVMAEVCLDCHSGENGSGLAKADLRHSAGGRTDCLLCHGDELHRFQPPAWGKICESCH